MASFLQSLESLKTSNRPEGRERSQEVSFYTETDNKSGLTATSYVDPLLGLTPRKQRWEIRRALAATGDEAPASVSEGSSQLPAKSETAKDWLPDQSPAYDWLTQLGTEIDKNASVDSILSFQTDGMTVTDRTVTFTGGSSPIPSAFDLAIAAVGRQYPGNATLTKQLDEWKLSTACETSRVAPVLRKIAQRFREHLGKRNVEFLTCDLTRSTASALRTVIEQIAKSGQLPTGETMMSNARAFAGRADLTEPRQITNLIAAIGHNQGDLKSVDLWGIDKWQEIVCRLWPLLRGEVLEIINSEICYRDTGNFVRYTVRLKGFPDGYTEKVLPIVFYRESNLVKAFHEQKANRRKPKPKDDSYAT